jgi:sugar (pentulose or hexulose) kinase
MQIFADVFGIPVVRNEVRNAAGLGAAICVAVACGVYPSFDDASATMVHREDRFEPNPENFELYAQLAEASAELSTQTDSILQRTHRILREHKGATAHV